MSSTPQPIRIAEAVGTAVGFGNENLGPVFAQLLPEVLGELDRAGVRPGMSVAHYEDYAEDGSVDALAEVRFVELGAVVRRVGAGVGANGCASAPVDGGSVPA